MMWPFAEENEHSGDGENEEKERDVPCPRIGLSFFEEGEEAACCRRVPVSERGSAGT